jgi:hypothetical protein
MMTAEPKAELIGEKINKAKESKERAEVYLNFVNIRIL